VRKIFIATIAVPVTIVIALMVGAFSAFAYRPVTVPLVTARAVALLEAGRHAGKGDAAIVRASRHFDNLVAQLPIPHRSANRGRKRQPRPSGPSPVSLKLSVGFDDWFRPLTIVPVRITAHNRTSSTVSGLVVIPDLSTKNTYQSYGTPGVFDTPLLLPAGATKQVTLYLPASGVDGEVQARMVSGKKVMGSAYDDPAVLGPYVLSVGLLTGNPQSMAWLGRIAPGGRGSVRGLILSPQTLGASPEALANLDAIVINDGTAASLTSKQFTALDQYVRDGGSLILVGGPSWQEALRPLPAALIPGRITGTATLSDLAALADVQSVNDLSRSRGAVTVSILRKPEGAVLASERGIPLAVDDHIGSGNLLYLGFDPAFNPIAHWPGAGTILTRLILRAMPAAAARVPAYQPSGMIPMPFFNLPGSSNLGNELDNVPSPALPTVVLCGILAGLYVLILGPLSFVVLRRLRRRGLLWLTIPVGAVLCTGATFGVASALKGNTILVNTIAIVRLDGPPSARQAQLYMGLFAPLRGDYRLTFDGSGYPESIPASGYGSSAAGGPPLNLFQEGQSPGIQFLHMNMWSIRGAGLSATVRVRGSVDSSLHINAAGRLVGWVRNRTGLTLIRPAVIAGRSFVGLRTMPPGTTAAVNVSPNVNVYNNSRESIWDRMFGQYPTCSYSFSCFNYGPAPESNLTQRIRNSVEQLPEAQTVTSLGEVLFVAWNTQPLGSMTVNGVTPERRDLNLFVKPLSAGFVHGPFKLRSGTFGASLIDVTPARSTSGHGCCFNSVPDGIFVGGGGSATFQFSLPQAGRVHLNHLRLYVNVGGANGRGMGRVWDWASRDWVRYDLSKGHARLRRPNRLVSSRGNILVKLVNTDLKHNMFIRDAHRYIQIAGDGYVR
jgi:hypothetical protein